ncbi:hypothetical protein LOK74_05930 [Brevibacillus humidisoli]|uniref:glycine zipper domain-containing protein n=1 Tax=Brevibacillus humidisoli TaxID=2895522 RepID=UPI001E2CA482|nr:glycine zipper domain-containing protein [Brevibacillus humidisoli]UFJ42037.1 hypothetical protein LOK74_05930 [Brevibacillus humidisoli]
MDMDAGAVVRIIAQNQLAPELREVVKSLKQVTKEVLLLVDGTRELTKQFHAIRQAVDQGEQSFHRSLRRMQQDVTRLGQALHRLHAANARPDVTVDAVQARREIAAIRQELQELGSTKISAQMVPVQATVSQPPSSLQMAQLPTGSSKGWFGPLSAESQALARLAAQGFTDEQQSQIQQAVDELTVMNPRVDRAQVYDLVNKALLADPENGLTMARQALQLHRIRPDLGSAVQYLNAQIAIKNASPNASVKGIGDALANQAYAAGPHSQMLTSVQKQAQEMITGNPTGSGAMVEGQLDQSFQTVKQADPLSGILEAQTQLNNQFIGLGMVLAKDLSPAVSAAANAVRNFNQFLNNLPPVPALLALGAAVAGVKMAMGMLKDVVIGAWMGMKDRVNGKFGWEGTLQERVRRKIGGGNPDNDKLQSFCCCWEDSTGSKKKRRKRNESKGGRSKDGSSKKGNASVRRNLSSQTIRRTLGGGGESREPKRKGWLERLKGGLGGLLPRKDTLLSVVKQAWDGITGMGRKALPAAGKMLRGIPGIGSLLGAAGLFTAEDKLDAVGKLGAGSLGAWGGAAAGAAIGSVVPVIGTAVGGIVGGTIGAFGGEAIYEKSQAIYEKVKAWFGVEPPKPPKPPRPPAEILKDVGNTLQEMASKTRLGMVGTALAPIGQRIWTEMKKKMEENRQAGQPGVKPASVPVVSPTRVQEKQRQPIALTVHNMPITLKADGILQDVGGLLRLLQDPSISNEIKAMVEKFFVDGIETLGGLVS